MNPLARFTGARRRTGAMSVAIAVTSWLTIGVSREAYAVTFSQLCTNNQTIEFKYDTSAGSTARERSWPSPGEFLQNQIDTYIDFRANPKVTGVRFRVAMLDLEPGEDVFRIFDNANAIHNTVLSGAATNFDLMVSFDALQSQGGYFQLQTDATIGSKNLIIDGATTTCGTVGPAGYAPLKLARRTMGLLTGTNDTVYMTVPLPPNNTEQTTLALWTETSGKDFDIYARCNALPTPTAYTVRGFASGSHEFVVIPPGTCNGGTMYVAVNSRSGSGTFSLVASHSFVQTPVHVVTNFAATNAQIDQFADSTVLAMKAIYGMTEGGWYTPEIKICNQAKASNCPNPTIVFDNVCVWTSATYGTGFGRGEAHICQNAWPWGLVVGHEAGHALMHLLDEYDSPVEIQGSQPRCGHTYYGGGPMRYNLCRYADHFQDKSPDATIFDFSQPSGWSSLNACTSETSATCWVPKQMILRGAAETPDNFPYNTFFPASGFVKVTKFY